MERHSSLVSIWLQLEICAIAVLLTRGEIRCYCDAPHCVATGYMCKSELNACFTRVLDPQSTKSPLSHGCYDPSPNSGIACRSESTYDALRGPAVLECCHEDMCNYRGLQDLTYSRGESLDRGVRPGADGGRHLVSRVQELPSAKEVWFRAAVIAVPVAGGLALALLVTLSAANAPQREPSPAPGSGARCCRACNAASAASRAGPRPAAKLDLECMVPLGAHESCCLTCDAVRQPELSSPGFLSLVHWGRCGGRAKLELV